MISTVSCAALMGIDAFRVQLEVDLSRSGMPAFTMVGLVEGAVRESKERVLSALRNSGFKLPPSRITVNLAPATVRKEGSAYDLPLALGLLAGAGTIDASALGGWYFAGELSLSGEVRPVSGILPMAVRARDEGAKGLVVPAANVAEASVVDGVSVYPAATLADVVRHVTGEAPIEPAPSTLQDLWAMREAFPVDFSEVKGQEHAKRAIEIASAGGHNLLKIYTQYPKH